MDPVPTQPIAPPPSGHHGSYREVILLAYPVVFTTLAATLMSVVDTLFMGWVSTTAQGAVGLGGIMVWTFASFFIGTLTVINTFVAQYFGEGRERECGVIAWQGFLLAAIFSVLVVGLSPLMPLLVGVFGAPADVAQIAVAYAMIRLLGLPLDLVETNLSAFLRGIGDTKTPMYVSLATVVLNVPLNYWLVFGGLGVAAMGARGAAIATVAARGLGMLLLALLVVRPAMRRRYGTGFPGWGQIVTRRIGALLKVGLPIGVGWLLEMATWLVFTGVVSGMGRVQLAAHNIVIQVLHLSFMPGVAISVAATTLVGQRLGAQDHPGARRSARASLVVCVGFMTCMGLIFLTQGGLIATAFNRDPAVVTTARHLFALAAAFQLFDALNMVSGGVLRGAGDTRYPMFVAVGFAWLVFMPLVWLLGIHLDYGVEGTWIGATTYITGLGIVLFLRVRAGKWTRYSVTGSAAG
jgi:MATE family, multidrug efflux pump